MKKFLTILGLLLLVIAGTVLVHTLILNANQKKVLAEKQDDCREKGAVFYRQFKITEPSSPNAKWDTPEYHYNTRLNTCLISWQLVSNIGGYLFKEARVSDILLNKNIITYSDPQDDSTWGEYIQKKNLLMSE